MIRAALVAALLPATAAAQDAVSCAALWTAYADFAEVSPVLDADGARAEAARFTRMAQRDGQTGAAARIEELSRGMYLTVRAMIEQDDAASRDLFERQMLLCAALRG